jgi:fructose-1,6-bisphosphatase/inositol monophosphatase family enzyme
MKIAETDIIELINFNLDKIISKRNDFVQKDDGSFVSKGDLLCDKLIKEYFAINFSEYIYITEESDRPVFDDNKLYIIVDPIDGTENFVSGIPLWGIGISIWKAGQHMFSMILLPELNLHISSNAKFKESQIYSRIHGLSSSLDEKLFVKSIKGKREVRILGCCMFSMYLILKGSLQCFSNPVGANVWDIMPGLIIAYNLGYDVKVNGNKYHGEILDFNKKHTFIICKN